MGLEPPGGAVRLFVCGDVMLGRGVDQILPHPGEPRLAEPWLADAREYVRLAEAKNGPIPRPVSPEYVWGEALAELEARCPHARIVNLETAVTARGEPEPKGINYRMHPANAGCLSAARVGCCVLANNHVMDFGVPGLAETLATLSAAGIETAGAGLDARRARAPAVLPLPTASRVLVFALGCPSSGVPESWAAGAGRPGVWLLDDFSPRARRELARRVRRRKRPGDVAVVSLHWGGNWGYAVPQEHRDLARALIDEGGADLVYGHSSHHPKGVEFRSGRPILYGCGDFIDDYEGIEGYEEYRDELGFMYFVSYDADRSRPARLELVPTRVERFRVRRAAGEDADFLARVLERESRPFGTRVERLAGGALRLNP